MRFREKKRKINFYQNSAQFTIFNLLLSDTGYGVDQHLVPFGNVPTVEVIVRALRDGQHVVLIHLFG